MTTDITTTTEAEARARFDSLNGELRALTERLDTAQDLVSAAGLLRKLARLTFQFAGAAEALADAQERSGESAEEAQQ